MFNLLSRWSKKPAQSNVTHRHARLRLESLEDRDVPATLTLDVEYYTGKFVGLIGTLSDHPNPTGQQIDFSGQVTGSTWTNSQGQFAIVTEAAGLGSISATAADSSSNTPEVTVTDVTPTLEFDAIEGPDHVWDLTGYVDYGGRMASMELYFGGAPVSLENFTTYSSSDGSYWTTVTLNGTSTDNGTAWVRALTAWGTWSDYYYEDFFQTGV